MARSTNGKLLEIKLDGKGPYVCRRNDQGVYRQGPDGAPLARSRNAGLIVATLARCVRFHVRGNGHIKCTFSPSHCQRHCDRRHLRIDHS